MQRNKAAILASGIDPELKRLHRLHAIRSRRKKQLEKAVADYEKALESVENYWSEVFRAIDENGQKAS